jgi:hypothetical protein
MAAQSLVILRVHLSPFILASTWVENPQLPAKMSAFAISMLLNFLSEYPNALFRGNEYLPGSAKQGGARSLYT